MQDMVEAEIWTIAHTDQGDAVLIRPLGLELSVPLFIGQFEAQSILIGLGGVAVKRPLTHDLFLDLMDRAGFALLRLEVYDLKNNTFYARLFFSGGSFSEKAPLVLEARPSDAFALSVRRKCPIFISRKVVEMAGVPLDFFTGEAEEPGPAAPAAAPCPESEDPGGGSDKYRSLRQELNQAVAAEEYERAAEIRDTLLLMEKEDGKIP
ncbi:MAG: bifunctional nuclease family protein [Treponema sp.]|jgi:bifunctional DNase/RNase|nr:bifunctional nuclease family protein [Treponema sp.]